MSKSVTVNSELADNFKSMGVSEENKEIVLSLLGNYEDIVTPQYNFSEFDSSDADTQHNVSETTDGNDTATSAELMPPPPSPNMPTTVTSQEIVKMLSNEKYSKMIWNRGEFLSFLNKSSTLKEKKKSVGKKIIETDQATKLTEYKLVFKDVIGSKSEILYSSTIDPTVNDYKKKVLEAFRADVEYQKSKGLIMKKLNKCVSVSI